MRGSTEDAGLKLRRREFLAAAALALMSPDFQFK
jgi:hypothetical protein